MPSLELPELRRVLLAMLINIDHLWAMERDHDRRIPAPVRSPNIRPDTDRIRIQRLQDPRRRRHRRLEPDQGISGLVRWEALHAHPIEVRVLPVLLGMRLLHFLVEPQKPPVILRLPLLGREDFPVPLERNPLVTVPAMRLHREPVALRRIEQQNDHRERVRQSAFQRLEHRFRHTGAFIDLIHHPQRVDPGQDDLLIFRRGVRLHRPRLNTGDGPAPGILFQENPMRVLLENLRQ